MSTNGYQPLYASNAPTTTAEMVSISSKRDMSIQTSMTPHQILDSLSPLLTNDGGIRPAEETEFRHLYGRMKDTFKLASRIIYCKILLSTSPDVLERILSVGFWDLINTWIKLSKEENDITLLLDLLRLLHTLPMNIERLKQNECPKIVKKLCKHDNQEIAGEANKIIKKWTALITATADKGTAIGQNGGAKVTCSASDTVIAKEKKRKTSESDSPEGAKKAKSSMRSAKTTTATGESASAIEKADSNSNASSDSGTALNEYPNHETFPPNEMNKSIVNKKEETKPRPSTAKVKQGKFRLDLSAPSTTALKTKKKPTDAKDAVKTAADLKKLPLNNISANGTVKVPKSSISRPVVQESLSFMEAISVVPVVNKKRRKLNKESEGTGSNKVINSQERRGDLSEESPSAIASIQSPYGSETKTSTNLAAIGVGAGMTMPPTVSGDSLAGPKDASGEILKSPPRYSFYKDILEDPKREEDITPSFVHSTTNDSAKVEVLPDSATSPDAPDNLPHSEESTLVEVPLREYTNSENKIILVKPILNYVKKGSGKSVRWPEDSKLVRVKLFELDENERINVNRLPKNTDDLADMKHCDMKHEALLMSEAKKQPVSYGTWILRPIIVPGDISFEAGKDSKERGIQAERMKTTLACLFPTDNPQEPEPELIIEGRDQMKIIPLEDENSPSGESGGKVFDYSQPPVQPVEQPPATNYNYGTNPASYNPEMGYPVNDNYPPIGNANYSPTGNSQYPVPPTNPNYMQSPSATFENANSNYSYNNYPTNGAPANQSPLYNSNSNAYPDYPSNNNYAGVAPLNTSAPNSGPPGPGYYPPVANNNYITPSSQQQPPLGNDSYNSFWPEGNNSGPPPPNNIHNNTYQSAPGSFNIPQQQVGPRPFFGGGRGGFHGKKAKTKICKFYQKNGACRFDTRCSFSHNLDNVKPPRY